jgi:hypothetical protein
MSFPSVTASASLQMLRRMGGHDRSFHPPAAPTAFSPFPPVHGADMEGKHRVVTHRSCCASTKSSPMIPARSLEGGDLPTNWYDDRDLCARKLPSGQSAVPALKTPWAISSGGFALALVGWRPSTLSCPSTWMS